MPPTSSRPIAETDAWSNGIEQTHAKNPLRHNNRHPTETPPTNVLGSKFDDNLSQITHGIQVPAKFPRLTHLAHYALSLGGRRVCLANQRLTTRTRKPMNKPVYGTSSQLHLTRHPMQRKPSRYASQPTATRPSGSHAAPIARGGISERIRH